MREAYGWENDDILWTATVFGGGIAGQQRASCGALSAAAICIGLRNRTPLADEDAAAGARMTAHNEAGELMRDFVAKFGAVSCLDLVGVEMVGKEGVARAREAGILDRTCHVFIPFILGKLYELEEKREQAV